MDKKLLILTTIAVLLYGCKGSKESASSGIGGERMEIKVTSTAFEDGGMIPAKYTCEGADISPPLVWEGIPEGAKSIAVISDDPDAPMGTWVHWVLCNLPGDARELPENIPAEETLSNGAKQGLNDFRRVGYGGPCPPSGIHRYFFKVYALGKMIEPGGWANKVELIQAMEGHVLAQGELVGRYKRCR